MLLGTASALVYGVSDFFGGVASRTQPALHVTIGAFAIAAVLDAPVLAVGSPAWSAAALGTGALGGVCGGIGTWLFYAALARGPVGVVAPAVALIAAVLPALVGLLRGEPIGLLTAVALVAVVCAGALLSVERQAHLRPDRTTVLLILAAGIPYGTYLVVIGLSPADSGAVPLEADLVVSTLLLLGVLAVQRLRRAAPGAPLDRPGPRGRPSGFRRAVLRAPAERRGLVIAAGLSQAVAGVLLVFALHLPALAIVGALSALYPVGTVVLGILVLHERARPFQIAGMVLAIGGVALLALARA
ncbi:MAG: family transporter [Amnibacterium sp.]|nr:family transporter [Amnibacterium sp.]